METRNNLIPGDFVGDESRDDLSVGEGTSHDKQIKYKNLVRKERDLKSSCRKFFSILKNLLQRPLDGALSLSAFVWHLNKKSASIYRQMKASGKENGSGWERRPGPSQRENESKRDPERERDCSQRFDTRSNEFLRVYLGALGT